MGIFFGEEWSALLFLIDPEIKGKMLEKLRFSLKIHEKLFPFLHQMCYPNI